MRSEFKEYMPSYTRLGNTLGFLAGLIVLVGATAWLYWQGLIGPLLLDDASNLRTLASLNESSSYWLDIVLGNSSGLLGRPVSMLSFAIDKVLFSADTQTYKYHNLIIHLLTGCLVVLLAFKLGRLAGLGNPAACALLIGALWLLTPLFVSTVLYLVQRMAQLSAFFALATLIAYVYFREMLIQSRRGLVLIPLVVLMFVLAALSKENGLLVLPLIVCIEIYFFNFRTYSEKMSLIIKRGFQFAGVGAALLIFLFLISNPGFVTAGYEGRNFSLIERLLTESRILWDYLFQLLVADTQRLGLYHDDYVISRGLLDPVSTLIAMLAWFSVFGLICYLTIKKRYPVFCFGVAFYLIAHVMESTIIPLELYFEHRNYLPGFGIYFVLVHGMQALLSRYSFSKPAIPVMIAIWLGLFSYQTGKQTTLWSNPHMLMLAHINEHPDSVRANAEAAKRYAELGDIRNALAYSERVRQLDGPDMYQHHIRNLALYCFANRPVASDYIQLVTSQAAGLRELRANQNLQVLTDNIINGRCPNFGVVELMDAYAHEFLVKGQTKSTTMVYALFAGLENHLRRYENAKRYIDLWLDREPDAPVALLMKLYFVSALNQMQERESVIERLQALESAGKLTREQSEDLALFL